MLEKWCAYINNLGVLLLFASVHMQIVAWDYSIIHSLVKLHLGSFLHNYKTSLISKVTVVR